MGSARLLPDVALLAPIVLLLSLLGTSCGPTQSTILINEAEVAIQKAELVDAANKAPYEHVSAKVYLYKAKEEWGYSDFEASLDYATLAKKFAEEALKKAKGISGPAKPNVPGDKPSEAGPKKPEPSSDPDADALEKF